MASTTTPTAKADLFFDLLPGDAPLELPDEIDAEHTDRNGQIIVKRFSVRKETLRGLHTAASTFAKHRLPEIEALLEQHEHRRFGKIAPDPRKNETRYYATNAAGYVMVNTKYIQEMENTYLAERNKGPDGKRIDGSYSYLPTARSKTVTGTNGKVHKDENWTTEVAITYETDRIIIQIAPDKHKKVFEEVKPSRGKRK